MLTCRKFTYDQPFAHAAAAPDNPTSERIKSDQEEGGSLQNWHGAKILSQWSNTSRHSGQMARKYCTPLFRGAPHESSRSSLPTAPCSSDAYGQEPAPRISGVRWQGIRY